MPVFFNINNINKRELSWLATFVIIAVPLFTYTLGTKESPFYYTISKIGNNFEYRLNFILWGVFTGVSLTFFIVRLFIIKSFHNIRARKLLLWALVFLVLTVLIPSLEHMPVMSKLHNIMAVAYALSLTTSLYLFIKHLSVSSQKIYGWSLLVFYIVTGGSLLMLLLFGMTGIFEIFFFISLSVFLAILNKKINKTPSV